MLALGRPRRECQPRRPRETARVAAADPLVLGRPKGTRPKSPRPSKSLTTCVLTTWSRQHILLLGVAQGPRFCGVQLRGAEAQPQPVLKRANLGVGHRPELRSEFVAFKQLLAGATGGRRGPASGVGVKRRLYSTEWGSLVKIWTLVRRWGPSWARTARRRDAGWIALALHCPRGGRRMRTSSFGIVACGDGDQPAGDRHRAKSRR